ncbi:hypothetical protein ACFL04_01780 [Patescibacteria group bacterium]
MPNPESGGAPGRKEIDAEIKRRDQFASDIEANAFYARKIGGETVGKIAKAFDVFVHKITGSHPDQIQKDIDRMKEQAHTEALDLNDRYDGLKVRYNEIMTEYLESDSQGNDKEVLMTELGKVADEMDVLAKEMNLSEDEQAKAA